MEKTQTKMVNSKKELREFVDFLMDCWNNQLYLAPRRRRSWSTASRAC